MSDGFRKLWIYIIPLFILGVVATCEDDFSIQNPFAEDESISDSNEVSSDTLNVARQMDVETPDTSSGSGPVTADVELENSPEHTPNNRTKYWRLVVGSVKDRSRAERMVSRIDHPGMEVIYVEYLDTYRIVYETYADLREAQQGFEEMYPRFPDAWIVNF